MTADEQAAYIALLERALHVYADTEYWDTCYCNTDDTLSETWAGECPGWLVAWIALHPDAALEVVDHAPEPVYAWNAETRQDDILLWTKGRYWTVAFAGRLLLETATPVEFHEQMIQLQRFVDKLRTDGPA